MFSAASRRRDKRLLDDDNRDGRPHLRLPADGSLTRPGGHMWVLPTKFVGCSRKGPCDLATLRYAAVQTTGGNRVDR